MKNVLKRSLSVVLALIIIFSSAVVGLGEIDFGSIFAVEAKAVSSGTCGENLTWELDDEGTLTISGEGEMYDYSYDSYAPWYAVRSSITSVVIDSGVKSIACYAFYKCTSLTSITIPDGVTTIGYTAFARCSNLTSITIPDSVTNIGDSAFYDTGYYNDTTNWDNNVLYVGNHLIEGSLSGEYTIKDGTKTIADNAFYECAYLTSIIIPDGVTRIGAGAFYSCYELKSIVIPNSVKRIGASAFDSCISLKSVIIPNCVTTIENYTFDGCDSLTSVVIPDSVTRIGNNAFSYCTSLTSVNIPDGVTSIGEKAFYWCKQLPSIIIPDSVTTIGHRAFYECNDLDILSIGSGVTEIGVDVFYACDTSELYLYSNLDLDEVPRPSKKAVFGDKVKKIGDFLNGSPVTEVVLGKGITALEGGDSGAFEGCYNLKEIVIPDSVTSIGEYAFSYCTSLSSVTIPDSVTIIGEKAFRKCTNLMDVYYSGSYSQWLNIKIYDFENDCLTNARIHFGKVDKPAKPKITAIANKSYGVRFEWSKVSGADSYIVYRKVSGGSYKYLGKTTKTAYADKTAKSGTKYYYVVKAVNEAGNSEKSASKGITFVGAPVIKTPSSSKSGITVKWGKVGGADGYIVYRKTGSGSYEKLAKVKGGTKVSYLDKSAKKGKTYSYKVFAYKGSTKSAGSAVKTIKDKY